MLQFKEAKKYSFALKKLDDDALAQK